MRRDRFWHDRPVTHGGPPRRQPASPLTGRVRLVRVGVLGLSAYGLAVGAHVAAGGAAPGWPVSLMLAALLGVLGVAFSARRRGRWALVGVLVATQAVLHGLFSLLDVPSAGCAVLTSGHHTMTAVCGPVDSTAMLVPSLPMLLAHLAATVATAWVLARGEAWLWRVVRSAFAPPMTVPPAEVSAERVLLGPDVRPSVRFTRPDTARAPPLWAAALV